MERDPKEIRGSSRCFTVRVKGISQQTVIIPTPTQNPIFRFLLLININPDLKIKLIKSLGVIFA